LSPVRAPGWDLTTSGASLRRWPSSPWRPTMSPSPQRSAFGVTSGTSPSLVEVIVCQHWSRTRTSQLRPERARSACACARAHGWFGLMTPQWPASQWCWTARISWAPRWAVIRCGRPRIPGALSWLCSHSAANLAQSGGTHPVLVASAVGADVTASTGTAIENASGHGRPFDSNAAASRRASSPPWPPIAQPPSPFRRTCTNRPHPCTARCDRHPPSQVPYATGVPPPGERLTSDRAGCELFAHVPHPRPRQPAPGPACLW